MDSQPVQHYIIETETDYSNKSKTREDVEDGTDYGETGTDRREHGTDYGGKYAISYVLYYKRIFKLHYKIFAKLSPYFKLHLS